MVDLIGVAEKARDELKSAQLRNMYRRDFQAWKADVLGLRTYEYMQEITNTALFGDINRTAIKSSNGTSKSFEVAAMIAWVGAVHDPGEAISIVTAPSIDQIDKVVFTYLKSFRQRAAERGNPLPGWINETLGWKFAGPQGNIDLAYGRKPSRGQEVAVFQGTRSQTGKTYVFIDEAGGVSKALFTAAEAVLTGAHARGIYIGNPDDPEAEWRKIFEDPRLDGEYNRFTISSFDLPTMTGEVVYPDDPDMQARMMESLTQRSWVEHKQRIWGERDARYQSKVLGQFPEDAGLGFFSRKDINTCFDTTIEDDLATPCVFGVDVARFGTDETVVYMNRGGRVRLLDAWGKTDTYESSRKVFDLAQRYSPAEIRIDSTGVGGAVLDNLVSNPEFNGAWNLVGLDGSAESPDLSKWANKRAYMHDSTKQQMFEGYIDLDVEDTELTDQLEIISYKFHNRGGIQIDKKSDMKTEMGGSPDRADAFIYATADVSPWTNNPLNNLPVGTEVQMDPRDMFVEEDFDFFSPAGLIGGAF